MAVRVSEIALFDRRRGDDIIVSHLRESVELRASCFIQRYFNPTGWMLGIDLQVAGGECVRP